MMLDFTQMVAMFCPSRKGRPVVAHQAQSGAAVAYWIGIVYLSSATT
jgi:hypothetical protein